MRYSDIKKCCNSASQKPPVFKSSLALGLGSEVGSLIIERL